MAANSSAPILHAIVLAAGRSSRFGATKLTQPLGGRPLLQHALLAVRGVCPGRVNLIVGHDQAAVREAALGLCDNVIVNSDYASGIGSSIAAGIRSVRQSADAVLILLADQPLISESHLQTIRDTWTGARDEIVATTFDDTFSPPILFPAGTFDELSGLSGDAGARTVLGSGRFPVKTVEFVAAQTDVDTPADLERLNQR